MLRVMGVAEVVSLDLNTLEEGSVSDGAPPSRLYRTARPLGRPSPFALWAHPDQWPTIPKNSQDVFIGRALEALGVAQFGVRWQGCVYPGSDAWTPEADALAEPLRVGLGDGWGKSDKPRRLGAYVLKAAGGGAVKKAVLPPEVWAPSGDWLTMLRSCRHPNPPLGSDGLLYVSRPAFLEFIETLPYPAPGERLDAARFNELIPPVGGRRVDKATDKDEWLRRILEHPRLVGGTMSFHAAANVVWEDLRRECPDQVHGRFESFHRAMWEHNRRRRRNGG